MLSNSYHRPSALFLLSFLASVSVSVSGAQAQETPSPREQIVVTASRYEQPLSQVGSSISVMTEAELVNGQYNYVVDALQTMPGITINQNGPFGGTATVSIRGAGGDRTLVLLDGIELNDASSPGGAYDFANLDPYGILRIEVLRGPQSILYGSSAIGGVVNIITPSGAEGFGGGGFVEGGSFGTVRGGATLYGGVERLSFYLTSNASRTNGISAADAVDGNTERDGHRNVSVNTKITALPTDNTRVELFVRYNDSRTEFDGFGPVDGDEIAFTEELALAGRFGVDLFDGRFHNTLSIKYFDTERRTRSNGAEGFGAQADRFNVDYLGVFEVNENWTLSAGAEHEKAKAKSVALESFTINSLFGEVGFTGVEGLTLTAGIRLDDHDSFGNVTSGRVTGSYTLPGTGTRVKGNWGQGFRVPSIFQLTFFCCGQSGPNLDLQPEESEAWEIGVEQYLADDKVRLELTWFSQDIDNLIIFTFIGGYDNVANSRQKGIEFVLDAQLTTGLKFITNYTFTKAIDLGTGERLIRTPRHMAFAQLNWQATDQLLVGLKLVYNGSEITFAGEKLDDWIRVDLNMSYKFNDTVTAYARIDNVFDAQYQQINGFGTPGVSVFGGMRASF